jgi:hypothetical protein
MVGLTSPDSSRAIAGCFIPKRSASARWDKRCAARYRATSKATARASAVRSHSARYSGSRKCSARTSSRLFNSDIFITSPAYLLRAQPSVPRPCGPRVESLAYPTLPRVRRPGGRSHRRGVHTGHDEGSSRRGVAAPGCQRSRGQRSGGERAAGRPEPRASPWHGRARRALAPAAARAPSRLPDERQLASTSS